jgi:hypothetical protein
LVKAALPSSVVADLSHVVLSYFRSAERQAKKKKQQQKTNPKNKNKQTKNKNKQTKNQWEYFVIFKCYMMVTNVRWHKGAIRNIISRDYRVRT